MITVLNLTKYNLTSKLKNVFGEDCKVIDYLNDPKTLDELDWSKATPTAKFATGRCAGYWLGMTDHKLDYIVLDVPKDEIYSVNTQITESLKMISDCKIQCLFVDVSIGVFLGGTEVPVSIEVLRQPDAPIGGTNG